MQNYVFESLWLKFERVVKCRKMRHNSTLGGWGFSHKSLKKSYLSILEIRFNSSMSMFDLLKIRYMFLLSQCSCDANQFIVHDLGWLSNTSLIF